jgi:hypothetical protein
LRFDPSVFRLIDRAQAKEVLTTYAENRAQLLPLENHIRGLMRREIYQFSLSHGRFVAP